MKKLITLLLLMSIAMLPVSDAAVVAGFYKPYVAPAAPAADYVPAYAKVPCGGAGLGNKFKVLIYDSSRNLIANGTSAEGTNSDSEQTVTFTDCAALTAGATYYVAIKQSNYQSWYTGAATSHYETTITYANAGPDPLATGNYDSADCPTMQIYNASNQRLLGDVTQSTTAKSSMGSGGQIVFYKGSTYTCVTL